VNAVDNLGFTAEDIANKNMHVLGMWGENHWWVGRTQSETAFGQLRR
jgi:hypothetical protein